MSSSGPFTNLVSFANRQVFYQGVAGCRKFVDKIRNGVNTNKSLPEFIDVVMTFSKEASPSSYNEYVVWMSSWAKKSPYYVQNTIENYLSKASQFIVSKTMGFSLQASLVAAMAVSLFGFYVDQKTPRKNQLYTMMGFSKQEASKFDSLLDDQMEYVYFMERFKNAVEWCTPSKINSTSNASGGASPKAQCIASFMIRDHKSHLKQFVVGRLGLGKCREWK